MTLPHICCLCPTYKRYDMLIRSIGCFLQQDYEGQKTLVIVDDSAHVQANGFEAVWRVQQMLSKTMNHLKILDDIRYVTVPYRLRTLPEKFNFTAGLAPRTAEIYAVWEDDDLYLPNHLSANVKLMVEQESDFAKMSQVYSDYPGYTVTEQADGRFHASMLFTRHLFRQIGGWPLTPEANFDQQMIKRLTQAHPFPSDICDNQYGRASKPTYCFCWGSTGDYHGQNTMESPTDPDWYDKRANIPMKPSETCERLLAGDYEWLMGKIKDPYLHFGYP